MLRCNCGGVAAIVAALTCGIQSSFLASRPSFRVVNVTNLYIIISLSLLLCDVLLVLLLLFHLLPRGVRAVFCQTAYRTILKGTTESVISPCRVYNFTSLPQGIEQLQRSKAKQVQ